jgi:hypothetical protein
MATGSRLLVGDSMDPCTLNIQTASLRYPEGGDFDVLFVDTPGFGLNDRTDEKTLDEIAKWLRTQYVRFSVPFDTFFTTSTTHSSHGRDIKLDGIIYFGRITDNRIARIPFSIVVKLMGLCGTDNLRNTILATTMWDEVDEKLGSHYERELRTKHWTQMIQRGSQMVRYLNTPESAREIIHHILQTAGVRSTF